MALAVKREGKRKFIFKGIELEDPNPAYDENQVREHYMGVYPDLLNTSVSTKNNNGVKVYEFKPKTGTHG